MNGEEFQSHNLDYNIDCNFCGCASSTNSILVGIWVQYDYELSAADIECIG